MNGRHCRTCGESLRRGYYHKHATRAHCRCDGTLLGAVDHCPTCGCEELEERCASAGDYSRASGRRVAA
jgi:hypothetical protein